MSPVVTIFPDAAVVSSLNWPVNVSEVIIGLSLVPVIVSVMIWASEPPKPSSTLTLNNAVSSSFLPKKSSCEDDLAYCQLKLPWFAVEVELGNEKPAAMTAS